MSEVIIAFDLETTGLDASRDEIVEIGAIPIIDGVVREDCAFHSLVDPDRPIPPDATQIHGITNEMVRGRPRIDVVLPEFLRYAGSHALLGHNAEFDVAFIAAACRKLELGGPCGRVHDTLLLSRKLHAAERKHDLDSLCRRLAIEIGTRHRSIDDVLLTCRAFLMLRDLSPA
jgi:DNA polymerase-3 subunit epsilon